MPVTAPSVQQETFASWYRRNRERSRALFDLLADDTYYSQPIDLRHPIVFYEGHLPAFSFNTLVKKALGGASIDDRLERLFARGIDPAEGERSATPQAAWPGRDAVRAFVDEADRRVLRALEYEDLDRPGDPLLDHSEAAFTILEHEAMHQETLLYMWRRLPYAHKRQPHDLSYEFGAAPPPTQRIEIPAGRATLGARRPSARVDRAAIGAVVPFGWDNEFDALAVDVPRFDIDAHSVTNAEFLEFIAERGYQRRELWDDASWEWREAEQVSHPAFWLPASGSGADAWAWRGMFEEVPLPLAWPCYVSQAEASAFARWKGRRLPSEAEYHRAAYGSPDGEEREFPWGAAPPQPAHGNFDFQSWEPVPAGARPAGTSAWGVHDLAGNGWEWTASEFAPFPGFTAMASYPEYSAEFFDGRHVVLKGASPATAKELIRRSFRNWFRTNYPYVYAKFRTVSS